MKHRWACNECEIEVAVPAIFFDLVMLVRAVAVDDEMNVEITGHVVLDMAQNWRNSWWR